MLHSLFDRLRGRSATAPSAPAAAPGPTPTAPPAAPQAPAGLGARRPLVSARGVVDGFEFALGESVVRRLRERADPVAITASTRSLLAAMRLCAQQGRLAYAEIPPAWVLRASADDAMEAGMYIALAPDDGTAPADAALIDAITAWRAAGARFGWALPAAGALAAALRPDFVVLRHYAAGASGTDRSVREARSGAPGVPLIALELPDIDLLEAALAAGATLAACRIDGAAEPRDARALPPPAQRLLTLLNALARDAETATIVAAIKTDVALAYRLLRQLNSAAVAPGTELGSIEQAVALLGRNELYRWVCVLLLHHAPVRPASQALQSMTLARARLFELLAERRGEPAPGALFAMGLASMLPLLLRTRLDTALESLHLHPLARQALMERQGPWAAYLALVEVLDEGALAEADELTAPFGGLSNVMADSAQAWLFATQARDAQPA